MRLESAAQDSPLSERTTPSLRASCTSPAHALSRRALLKGALASAAAALPLAALACGSEKGGALSVGGLPVTCNLTLPVACAARAATGGSLPYVYQKFNGWPEIKESLMAGRIQA